MRYYRARVGSAELLIEASDSCSAENTAVQFLEHRGRMRGPMLEMTPSIEAIKPAEYFAAKARGARNLL